jgi:hypothetical protein
MESKKKDNTPTEDSSIEEVSSFFKSWNEGKYADCFGGVNGKSLMGYSKDDLIFLSKQQPAVAIALYNELHPQGESTRKA